MEKEHRFLKERCDVGRSTLLRATPRFIDRLERHAAHGFDPDQVIRDMLDARNVFNGDSHCLTLAFVEDRAPNFDRSVTHHDIDEIFGNPPLPVELGINLRADWRITLALAG